MNLIVKSIFGSHLYGMNNENSDIDYKGIYLPTKSECYLNSISKSINNSTGDDKTKNGAGDIDEEIYSLQYFMRLASKGEMIVIDMIHTPEQFIIEQSDIWAKLRAKKDMFYSKSLHGYLGYIKKQTSKYGIKGDRLNAMEEVKKYLEQFPKLIRMKEVWDNLPVNKYSYEAENPNNVNIRMYECCGRKFHETVTVEYALDVIDKLYAGYGARAQKAKNNEGIDWKAVSHAFRAGYQLIEIYKTKNLIYPLESAEYLKDIKEGKLHYQNDNLAQKLDDILDEVQVLADVSGFPKKVNPKLINNFILQCYDVQTKNISTEPEVLGDGMCDHCKQFTKQGKYINGKWTCSDCKE